MSVSGPTFISWSCDQAHKPPGSCKTNRALCHKEGNAHVQPRSDRNLQSPGCIWLPDVAMSLSLQGTEIHAKAGPRCRLQYGPAAKEGPATPTASLSGTGHKALCNTQSVR